MKEIIVLLLENPDLPLAIVEAITEILLALIGLWGTYKLAGGYFDKKKKEVELKEMELNFQYQADFLNIRKENEQLDVERKRNENAYLQEKHRIEIDSENNALEKAKKYNRLDANMTRAETARIKAETAKIKAETTNHAGRP